MESLCSCRWTWASEQLVSKFTLRRSCLLWLLLISLLINFPYTSIHLASLLPRILPQPVLALTYCPSTPHSHIHKLHYPARALVYVPIPRLRPAPTLKSRSNTHLPHVLLQPRTPSNAATHCPPLVKLWCVQLRCKESGAPTRTSLEPLPQELPKRSLTRPITRALTR